MNRFLKTAVFLFLLLACYSSLVCAGEVTDRIRTTLEKFINTLNDPELKKVEMTDQRKSALHQVLKDSFDEEEFARRSLKGHWGKLSEAERKEFASVFIDLLKTTYFEKIDAYAKGVEHFSSENITYINEKVIGKFAVVETKVEISNNGCVRVDYRMINKNEKWVVCDLVIEGVSIVKNYRAQFNEVLANSSFNDLLIRLKGKKG
jgi:phospholipid transport system substrate-binding protein